MNNYIIPGTDDRVQINDNRELSATVGVKKNIPRPKRPYYAAMMYGRKKRVSGNWLYWLARFNLRLEKPYQHHIFDFRFARRNPKYDNHTINKEPMVVYLDSPVYTDDTKEFRLIPRFPKYAIAKNGHMLYLPNQQLSKPTPTFRRGEPHYSTHHIRGVNKNLLTHVLVASAWVDNPDWANNLFVDHIDGNKSNCNSSNLRWVDFTGDNNAKIDQGLPKQAIAVKVRNIDTSEVTEYPSIRRACAAIYHTTIDPAVDPLTQGRVWIGSEGRYEILPVDGFKAWSYIDSEPRMTRRI